MPPFNIHSSEHPARKLLCYLSPAPRGQVLTPVARTLLSTAFLCLLQGRYLPLVFACRVFKEELVGSEHEVCYALKDGNTMQGE